MRRLEHRVVAASVSASNSSESSTVQHLDQTLNGWRPARVPHYDDPGGDPPPSSVGKGEGHSSIKKTRDDLAFSGPLPVLFRVCGFLALLSDHGTLFMLFERCTYGHMLRVELVKEKGAG